MHGLAMFHEQRSVRCIFSVLCVFISFFLQPNTNANAQYIFHVDTTKSPSNASLIFSFSKYLLPKYLKSKSNSQCTYSSNVIFPLVFNLAVSGSDPSEVCVERIRKELVTLNLFDIQQSTYYKLSHDEDEFETVKGNIDFYIFNKAFLLNSTNAGDVVGLSPYVTKQIRANRIQYEEYKMLINNKDMCVEVVNIKNMKGKNCGNHWSSGWPELHLGSKHDTKYYEIEFNPHLLSASKKNDNLIYVYVPYYSNSRASDRAVSDRIDDICGYLLKIEKDIYVKCGQVRFFGSINWGLFQINTGKNKRHLARAYIDAIREKFISNSNCYFSSVETLNILYGIDDNDIRKCGDITTIYVIRRKSSFDL